MISIKSYLSRGSDVETDTSYRRIISLFLQGIALHAVDGDKADRERFRGDIEKCLATVSPETPMSELLVVVGGALRAMEDYNQRTSKFVRRQNTELQHMLSMLTETGSRTSRSPLKAPRRWRISRSSSYGWANVWKRFAMKPQGKR